MTFKHMKNNNYCHFNVRNLAAELRFECLFLCCFLVFSVITISLRPQTQGNIWLFDDTVLITRKASGMSDKTSLLPIILFNYPYCYFYIENRFKNVIIYNLMQYIYICCMEPYSECNTDTQNFYCCIIYIFSHYRSVISTECTVSQKSPHTV